MLFIPIQVDKPAKSQAHVTPLCWNPWGHPVPDLGRRGSNYNPLILPTLVTLEILGMPNSSLGIPGGRPATMCPEIQSLGGCHASTCSWIHQCGGPRRSTSLYLPRDLIPGRPTCLDQPEDLISRRLIGHNLLGDLHPNLRSSGSQEAAVLGWISFSKTHPKEIHPIRKPISYGAVPGSQRELMSPTRTPLPFWKG